MNEAQETMLQTFDETVKQWHEEGKVEVADLKRVIKAAALQKDTETQQKAQAIMDSLKRQKLIEDIPLIVDRFGNSLTTH